MIPTFSPNSFKTINPSDRDFLMRAHDSLLSEKAPNGVSVHQLTNDAETPCCHVYMEAPVFTPDSSKLILHRAAHPHGPDKEDPRHAYLLCDLNDDGSLQPLTGADEFKSTSPCVSPDGKWFYYFIDETEIGGGRLSLRRVGLDGTERETLFVLDSPIPGSRFRASQPYCLSTISADGERIALQVFLGDGHSRNSPFGVLVFDLKNGTVSLPLWGATFCNTHAQYARATDPERVHDLLIQENHGVVTNVRGKSIHTTEIGLVDLHVIRDDGTNVRDVPLGADGRELCSGHQCWRGDSEWVIASVITLYGRGLVEEQDFRLVEALPAPGQGHLGSRTWWGVRNDLTPFEERAGYNHFGVDLKGTRLLTEDRVRGSVAFCELPAPGAEPISHFTELANTNMRQSMRSTVDSHPFLSPDGKRGFFNSNESGQLQAYMIDGLERPF